MQHADQLIFEWTREADRFVAGAMQQGAPVHVVDALAYVVVQLDGQTDAGLQSTAAAAKAITTWCPAYLKLVGRESAKGYAERRATFDRLTQLAQRIEQAMPN